MGLLSKIYLQLDNCQKMLYESQGEKALHSREFVERTFWLHKLLLKIVRFSLNVSSM